MVDKGKLEALISNKDTAINAILTSPKIGYENEIKILNKLLRSEWVFSDKHKIWYRTALVDKNTGILETFIYRNSKSHNSLKLFSLKSAKMI